MLDIARNQSTLKIEGDLAARGMLSDLTISAWSPPDQTVLPNTELLVGVSRESLEPEVWQQLQVL